MNDMLIVKPHGIQSSRVSAPPTPFNFEQGVLAGGALDPKLVIALSQLFLMDMFPEPSTPTLYSWNALVPNEMFSFVEAYYALNDTINGSAISKGRPISPISDVAVRDRVSRVGFLSPLEIETKFIPKPRVSF